MRLQALDHRPPIWNMDTTRERLCPVCESSNNDRLLLRPDNLSVRKCQNCSTLFVSPCPSENDLNRFYTDYSRSHFTQKQRISASDYWAAVKSLEYGREPKTTYVANYLAKNPGAKLLDYGSSIGIFANFCARLGASVTCCDLDREAINTCRKFGLTDAIFGDTTDLAKRNDSFDLIILNDVIEHPIFPIEMLTQLRPLLRPNGQIMIWTPNGENGENDAEKIMFRVDLEHLQYFTCESILTVCNRVDLTLSHLEKHGYPSIRRHFEESKLKSARTQLIKLLGRLKLLSFLLVLRNSVQKQTNKKYLGDYSLLAVLKKKSR